MTEQNELDELAAKGKRCLRAGQTDEAVGLFQQVIDADADRADVHEALAAAYFRCDEYEKAIKHFQAVSRLDPRQTRTDVNIGAIYNRMGRYSDAVTSLRRGIQRDRKCSEGYYNIGLAYRGLNQTSMAVSAYREAIRLEPEMEEAHLNLANVFVEMGNFQQAVLHYRKALEIRPGFSRAERGMAEAERRREKAKQEISPFGRLVTEEQLANAAIASPIREMSDQERLEDRHEVRHLSVETTADTAQLLACLRKELEPALMALARGAAERDDSPLALGRSLPQFQAAVRNYLDIRATQKRKLDQLKSHEVYVTGGE